MTPGKDGAPTGKNDVGGSWRCSVEKVHAMTHTATTYDSLGSTASESVNPVPVGYIFGVDRGLCLTMVYSTEEALKVVETEIRDRCAR